MKLVTLIKKQRLSHGVNSICVRFVGRRPKEHNSCPLSTQEISLITNRKAWSENMRVHPQPEYFNLQQENSCCPPFEMKKVSFFIPEEGRDVKTELLREKVLLVRES